MVSLKLLGRIFFTLDKAKTAVDAYIYCFVAFYNFKTLVLSFSFIELIDTQVKFMGKKFSSFYWGLILKLLHYCECILLVV